MQFFLPMSVRGQWFVNELLYPEGSMVPDKQFHSRRKLWNQIPTSVDNNVSMPLLVMSSY